MERTGSVRAKVLLDDWEEACTRFVRLAPKAEVREISSADEGAVVKD
jgi:glutamate synthase domain-containing protein 3